MYSLFLEREYNESCIVTSAPPRVILLPGSFDVKINIDFEYFFLRV